MDFPALKEAQGKLDAARKEIADVMREAKDGDRYDMDKITSVPGDKAAKLEWIRAKNGDLPALKAEVESLRVVSDAANTASDYDNKGDDQGAERKDREDVGLKGIGELFTASEAFKTKGRTSTFDTELKTLFQTTAGWPPESVRSGRVETTPQRPATRVVDHIPAGTINQALYKYMEETTFASDSSDSDNLATAVSEGGTFGEAQLALTERSKTVEKLTIWLQMTDEQLEDVDSARSYVQQRLTYMMQAKLDAELLKGSGSTPHILGTENVSGIQTQAKGADTLLDAAYKLFTSIRTDGFAEPNVAFVNPLKWQEVDLLKTADGQYIWGHPSGTGPRTLWGIPTILTTAGTSTKLVAGDYAQYAMLFLKRGIDVQVTNSHASFFISGKQAIRMDSRQVLVHFRPKAFGVVTGL